MRDSELKRLMAAQRAEMRKDAESASEPREGYESESDSDAFEELRFE